MNLEKKQQLARDCQAAGVQVNEGVADMLTQLWAIGLKVPPLFIWPAPLLILYYVFYVNDVFLLFLFLMRNSIEFFPYPNSWTLPVMCWGLALGSTMAALRHLRIRKKFSGLPDGTAKHLKPIIHEASHRCKAVRDSPGGRSTFREMTSVVHGVDRLAAAANALPLNA